MRCPNCKTDSMHIRINSDDSIGCSNCMGFSETGGSRTDKILTRNSHRVTEEQIQYEGDTITPYIVDKSTNQVVINEEFINLYPQQAANTYTKDELKAVGQSDLTPTTEVQQPTNEGVEFNGIEEEAMSDILRA